MGEVDLGDLHKIYRKCVDYCKQENLPYKFKVDSGNYETAIEFWAMGYHHPPKSANWNYAKSQDNEIKCPDLLDYHNKLIIEYEEESKPGKRGGKLGKKGHTEESNKDEHRDQLYRIAGFKLLKFWETDLKEENWNKIYNFLKLSNEEITR